MTFCSVWKIKQILMQKLHNEEQSFLAQASQRHRILHYINKEVKKGLMITVDPVLDASRVTLLHSSKSEMGLSCSWKLLVWGYIQWIKARSRVWQGGDWKSATQPRRQRSKSLRAQFIGFRQRKDQLEEAIHDCQGFERSKSQQMHAQRRFCTLLHIICKQCSRYSKRVCPWIKNIKYLNNTVTHMFYTESTATDTIL